MQVLHVRAQRCVRPASSFYAAGESPHDRPKDDHRGGERGYDDQQNDGRPAIVQKDQVRIERRWWRDRRGWRHPLQ
jgi:hypothetical protein